MIMEFDIVCITAKPNILEKMVIIIFDGGC